jgi:hypothetical protein
MSDISGKPHMGDHTGAVCIAENGGLAGLDMQAGTKLFAVLTTCAAIAGAGGIFCGEGKGLPGAGQIVGLIGNDHGNSSFHFIFCGIQAVYAYLLPYIIWCENNASMHIVYK